MADLAKPSNYITDASDLKVGDHIWHVYGIWPPQEGDEHVVTRAACKFSEHREYSDIHTGSSEEIVFDVRWTGSERPTMHFASDGNLIAGRSTNNNYWFRSAEAAQDAVSFLRSEWESKPGLIAAEVERREFDRAFDYDDHEGYQEAAS